MTSSIQKTLCVLAVHYNNADEVRRYVDHVLGLPLPTGWRVVVSVTDNSRSWPTGLDMDRRCFIWAPEANLGYLNGCAYGLACWISAEGYDPDWVAVTNTDITFDQDAFLQLLTTAWDETVGAVAPHVVTPSGLVQNPFLLKRPPAWRLRVLAKSYNSAFARWILNSTRPWRRPIYAFLQSYKASSLTRNPNADVPHLGSSTRGHRMIYAAHGSVVFLTKRFFESGGELATPSIMFGEEIHLAEQLMRSSLLTIWAPEIHVVHMLASTTADQSPDQILEWKAQALGHLVHRYFN